MANKSVKYQIDAKTLDAIKNINGLSDSIKKSINALEDQGKETKKSGQTFSVFMGNLAANATGQLISAIQSLGRQVFSFGGQAISAASQMEDLSVQFKTLTGSASQAKQIMENLTTFAANTPFQLEGLAKVSSQLLSFGFEVDDLEPKLQRIGDVAAASGTDISDLGLIFGQVSAAGKLTGERLLQLQERGIPILSALATKLGTNQAAVRNMVTQGKIDFKTFEEAFNSLSDKGGFAFEGMIAKSQTLSGLLSTLGDNWTLKLAEIGKAFAPVSKALVKMGIDLLQAFDTKMIVDWLKNGLFYAIDGLKIFAENINNIIAGFKTLWNIGQIVVNGFQAGIQGIAKVVAEFMVMVNDGLIALTSNIPDSFLPENFKKDLESGRDFWKEFSTEASKQFGESSDAIQRDIDDIGNAWKNNAFSDETIDLIKSKLDTIKQAALDTNQAIAEDNDAQREKVVLDGQMDIDAFLAQEQQRLDYIRDILGQEESLKNEARIRELAAKGDLVAAKKQLDGEYAKAVKDDIFTMQKWENLSQKDRVSNLKSTLGQIANLQSSGSKELFIIGKAAAVATATIDGIAATQKALASAPPPFNFALAALVGTASALNIAKIASAPPPGFERGGIVPGNSYTGDNVLAGVNSGEMILNRQQQSNLFDLAKTGGAGGGQMINVHTTVELDGEKVGYSVSRQVANGLVLGEVQ